MNKTLNIIDEPFGFAIPEAIEIVDPQVEALYSVYRDNKWKVISDYIDNRIKSLNSNLNGVSITDYETIGKLYALNELVRQELEALKRFVEETGGREDKLRRATKRKTT